MEGQVRRGGAEFDVDTKRLHTGGDLMRTFDTTASVLAFMPAESTICCDYQMYQ